MKWLKHQYFLFRLRRGYRKLAKNPDWLEQMSLARRDRNILRRFNR